MMCGVDHSSCNWDGDDVVNGCPALTLTIVRMSIRKTHERSTHEIELDSSEDFL